MPWPDPSHATSADLACCRALIRTGSRSFHAAAMLLPARVRDPATSLYAFCRLADDAVDLGADADAALDELRERLHLAYAGRPRPDPADRAFADVVARFAIPRALPEALLEGFAWDARGRRYETLDDLAAYAARVAGSVGAMMALLMERRDPTAVSRACDLGIAMQLTNIARDVADDAALGRLYLPAAWVREIGLDPDDWLARPRGSDALFGLVRRLLAAADGLYARADEGIALLPSDCRPGIAAARLFYAEIGREVERAGAIGFGRRAVVPGPRKLALAAAACAPRRVRQGAAAEPLDQTRFLVEAVALSVAPPPRDRSVGARALWVLDLFERLHRRAEA